MTWTSTIYSPKNGGTCGRYFFSSSRIPSFLFSFANFNSPLFSSSLQRKFQDRQNKLSDCKVPKFLDWHKAGTILYLLVSVPSILRSGHSKSLVSVTKASWEKKLYKETIAIAYLVIILFQYMLASWVCHLVLSKNSLVSPRSFLCFKDFPTLKVFPIWFFVFTSATST